MSSLPGPSRTVSPKSAIRRSQKPYSGRPNGQAKLKKKESTFFDGLKNIVTGPLSWLTAIGKDRADSDEENIPGDDSLTGSKRRGVSGQKARGNSPARKRQRLESSPQPDAGASDTTQSTGGYLDPPMVLRDSIFAPNVSQGANRTGGVLEQSLVKNGTSEIDGSHGLGITADGRRPHRPVGSSRSLLLSEELGTRASHSPLVPLPALRGTATVVSPNSGVRRTTGLIGARDESPEPLRRRQSSVIQLSVGQRRVSGQTQTSDGDQSMLSPVDSVFPRGRSPAVGDVNMRGPMSSPERDRTHGPLRMGSLLRQSHTPHESVMRSVSPTKPGLGNRNGSGIFQSMGSSALARRSSSMMNVDQPAANALGKRSSSQVIFDPAIGITSPEELAQANQATAPKARAPRNNAERILIALEQATPLTEARKLRQKQKEAVRVPASSSGLGSRTSRMLNPYGRPLPTKAQAEQDSDASVSARQPGALRRYLDAQKVQVEKKNQQGIKEQEVQMETIEETTEPMKETSKDRGDKMVEDKAPVTPTKQDKAVEASPEEIRRPAAMPGRASSSLRAGRAPAFRTHVASSRPTNKFSAKFVDDDDDAGMQEDSASLTPAELSKWVERGAGGLEVPTGFSFDFSKAPTILPPPKPQAAISATEDAKKANEKREALLRALRGDKPIGLNPLDSLGPPKLPSVPSIPFMKTPLFATSMATAPLEVPKPAADPTPKPAPANPSTAFQPPSFTLPTTANFAPKSEAEIAPKTANGPVSALPFSFGAPAASKSAPTLPFSFAPTGPSTEKKDAGKPAPFVFNLATPVSEKPATAGTTFSFGTPPSFTPPASEPTTKPATPSPDTTSPDSSDPKRSTAPSPSPFAVSMIPTTAPVEAPKAAPVFSFGPSPSTAAQPTATLFGNAKESNPSAPASKSPFSFTSPPAAATPSSAPSIPSITIPTATPSVQPPSFSFTAPTPTTTSAAEPATKANPFGGIGLGAPPSGAPTPAPSTQTPSFSFSFGAKPDAPKPSFSFGAPAAPKPEASTGFSFSGTTTPAANGTGFSFGTGLKPVEAPQPPKTPPTTISDAMDEGSPPQVTPAHTPVNGAAGFSFGSTAPPSIAASSTPSFGFAFSAPPAASNPFQMAASAAPAPQQNPFAPAPTSVSSPVNPFAQPAPSSPFPSQPNSPFASPAPQHQVINSPAPSNSAFTFGSPQTAPGAFTFAAGGGSVLSPSAPGGTPTTPTFVFGKGVTSPNDRPVKALPGAKRPGALGARRATSGRK